MKNLVVWPSPGGKFTDTEEGWMRAYAIFGCTQDSKRLAGAHILKPAVITGEQALEELDLFPNFKLVTEEPEIQELLSRPLCAVVGLGSTPHSLWNESPGEYFAITRGSLTPEGEIVIRTLESTYDNQVTFLTALVS